MILHEFTMGDVEDPYLYAAFPISDWQQTEMGKWVMDHAVEQPRWDRFEDYSTLTSRFAILARLTEQDITFFELKFK